MTHQMLLQRCKAEVFRQVAGFSSASERITNMAGIPHPKGTGKTEVVRHPKGPPPGLCCCSGKKIGTNYERVSYINRRGSVKKKYSSRVEVNVLSAQGCDEESKFRVGKIHTTAALSILTSSSHSWHVCLSTQEEVVVKFIVV